MRTLSFIAALAVVGLAAPSWAQGQSSTEAAQSPPDIDGVWALKLVTAAKNNAPVIGDVATETTSYEKVTINQNGTSLELSEQVCDIRVRSSQDAVETVIPDQFVRHIRTVERPGKLVYQDGEWRLNVPKHLKYFGVRPSIGSAKLPEDKDSRYIFDQDEDNHPGMTISLSGLLSGDLYVIQRSWDVLQGKRYKSGQFAGPLQWDTDQIVLEKTGRIFGEMDPSTPVDKNSYFRLVPVDDNTTCKEIAQNTGEIF